MITVPFSNLTHGASGTVLGVEDTVLGHLVLLSDPFYWINPGVLVLIAVLPVLLLQITVGLVFLCLQRRLRGIG